MEKLIIKGGKKLHGQVTVSGAKNVALKALVAACLTEDEVVIKNIPHISDFFIMSEIIQDLGGLVRIKDHTAYIQVKQIKKSEVALEKAAAIRTSSLFLAPLLARIGKAVIPNPGGCRIGARPIDRTINGLELMGSKIRYESRDGYFHAKAVHPDKLLYGVNYMFEKNTHTGTETLILASVLASGRTVLNNAALEPEIDELISLLNDMGAQVRRENKTIVIDGVDRLHGTEFTIGPDRNEIVTFAVAAIITQGDITVTNGSFADVNIFLENLQKIGGGYEETDKGLRFFYKGQLQSTDITTLPYPGFMTDWQGPWAVLMTKAQGTCVIHETVYENRLGYIKELKKMGARMELFNPVVSDPKTFYNFNQDDEKEEYFHAVRIFGPTQLHNGVLAISDLRAGATLVLAALAAAGTTVIFGVEHLDRGYERFDQRLKKLGGNIKRESDE